MKSVTLVPETERLITIVIVPMELMKAELKHAQNVNGLVSTVLTQHTVLLVSEI